MDFKKIAESYKDEFYKTLKELISINSIKDIETARDGAPFGEGCLKALEYMLELGKKDGFKVKNYDGYCGVIEYGDAAESIGILAHLDTVTVSNNWDTDPFDMILKEGYIFGRGVSDDKGPALAGYFAMKALKDNGIVPKRKIMLIIGCDEESGSECMKYYLNHGEIPTFGFTPDADFPVIYGESGIMQFNIIGELDDSPIIDMISGQRANIVPGEAKATLRGIDETQEREFNYYIKSNSIEGRLTGNEINIKGLPVHAIDSYKGINAGLYLLKYIGISYDNNEILTIVDMFMGWRGDGLGIDQVGSYMGFLSTNVGVIKIKNNKIELTVDIRYPNEVDPSSMLSKIKSAISNKLPGFKVVNVNNTSPLFVDPNSPMIIEMVDAYREVTGDTFTPPRTTAGGTYAKSFKNFVAFGCTFPNKREPIINVGGMHQDNEGMLFDDLIESVAIFTDALIRLQEVALK